MADTIRELIFLNIQETLKGILNRDGYENNVDPDNVILIHGKRDDSAYKEPIIYIYPGQERTIIDKCEKGKDYNELDIPIEVFIRGKRDTMNTNINKMLGDLKKALGADHTRGGYAIDTVFVYSEPFITDLTSEKCGLILQIQVNYCHPYGNPYEN